MSNVFVCQIDKKTFSSEEELVKHMLTDHTMQHANDVKIEHIVNKLQEVFPFAKINVQKANKKEFGEWHVQMIWAEKECDFNFYVGEHDDIDYYYNQFETVEKAVTFYQNLLRLEQEGKGILEKVFQPEEIRVGQIFEGDMHSATFVSFEMIKNKKTYFERFELGTTKEEFARKMSGYFDKVVEGEITVIEDCSGSGSEPEYLLDGVPIWHLIKRGKKMKIEILEEKEDLK